MATNTGPLPKPEKRNKKRRFLTPIDPIWLKVKEDWFAMNPPDLGEEYYQCALCPFPVHLSEVSLDHKIPRSRRPDLRYAFDNLQPTHWVCNMAKGSRVL